MDTLISPK